MQTAGFVLSLLTASSVLAAPIQTDITFKSKGQAPLRDKALYLVEIRCSPRPAIADLGSSGVFGFKTVTEIVLLSESPLSEGAFPTDASNYPALFHVFSASGKKVDKSVFDNSNCKQDFLLSGGKQLYLGASLAWGTTHDPSAFVTAAYGALGVLTPLAPVLGFGSLATTFSSISSSQAPLKSFFSLFDQSSKVVRSSALHEGRTTIQTSYADVTVNLQAIRSVTESENQDLLRAFRKTYGDAKTAISGAQDSTAQCHQLEAKLADSNLASIDVAVALGNAAGLAGFDKGKAMDCLGRSYAPLVAGAKFWDSYPDTAFTAQDAKAHFIVESKPEQPATDFIVQELTKMVGFWGGYARATVDTRAPYTTQIDKRFAPSVKFTDSANVAGVAEENLQVEKILDALILNGIGRFGCVGITSKSAGYFLAIRSEGSGPKGAFRIEDTTAVYAWFDEDQKVDELQTVYDVADILKALARNGQSCGPVVQIPKPPPS